MSTVCSIFYSQVSCKDNIFINDLFYFMKNGQLLNFANDKTIANFSNSIDDIITDLLKESENAIGFA